MPCDRSIAAFIAARSVVAYCGVKRAPCGGHYGRHAWRSDPMAGGRSFQMELHPWALGTALTRTKEAYLSVAPDMYGGFASSGRVESFTSRVERN